MKNIGSMQTPKRLRSYKRKVTGQRSRHEVETKAEKIKKHNGVDKEKIMATPRTQSHFKEELVDIASETSMPQAISPKVEKISSSF